MSIRIVPMDLNNSEFLGKDIPQIQNDYFVNHLNNDGWYKYQKSGIEAEDGDLLLFQINNLIIASAIYDMPMRKINQFIVRKGTVKVFKPIDKNEFQNIFDDFKRFSNAKYIFKPTKEQMDLLTKRMNVIE